MKGSCTVLFPIFPKVIVSLEDFIVRHFFTQIKLHPIIFNPKIFCDLHVEHLYFKFRFK